MRAWGTEPVLSGKPMYDDGEDGNDSDSDDEIEDEDDWLGSGAACDESLLAAGETR